jgi:hypothetical protein
LGGLRHGDKVTVEDREWVAGEERWWYLVSGHDEYTAAIGRTVTGWVPESNVAGDKPEPYPLGQAWVEFALAAQEGMDIPIWNQADYFLGAGRPVGAMWHGTFVEILDTQWVSEHDTWVYEIEGPDVETQETVVGWLHGTFIVLSAPP